MEESQHISADASAIQASAPDLPSTEKHSKITGDLGRKPTVVDKIGLVLSGVFSPLIVPTYACVTALWISILGILPEKVRFFISLFVLAVTALIPLAAIIFMIKTGRVSDAAISDRKQRAVPYSITGICYLIVAGILWYLGLPNWFVMFFCGAFVCTILAVTINFKWKISAHLTTMGGWSAMIFYIAFNHFGVIPMLPWISIVLLLSGMVGSARILLGRHTPMQVYAGWLMGLIVVYLLMSI